MRRSRALGNGCDLSPSLTIGVHVMMRQIMALFDEYQSKENGKHVSRALKGNAR